MPVLAVSNTRASQAKSAAPPHMPKDEGPCIICRGEDTEGWVLLCEGCTASVHVHCVLFTEHVGNGMGFGCTGRVCSATIL